MKKSPVAIFTKTELEEMPRMRHQLAFLLERNGHDVLFFENPIDIFKFKSVRHSEGLVRRFSTSISRTQTYRLAHPKLHLVSIINYINNKIEMWQIKHRLRIWAKNRCAPEDIVFINFNYDYYFLAKLPSKTIITILNDDFVAQSQWFCKTVVARLMDQTVKSSNYLLSTSPIQLSSWPKKKEKYLFLPWAFDVKPKLPLSNDFTKVLIWGYLTDRLDYELIAQLLDIDIAVKIYLFGEVDANAAKSVEKLKNTHSERVFLMGRCDLNHLQGLNFGYCLIPYRSGLAECAPIYASNKVFQVLSIGLPIIATGVPNFLRDTCVRVVENVADIPAVVVDFQMNYEKVRINIETIVANNSGNARYDFLSQFFN